LEETMKIRRVATGHNEDGKAVFTSDEELDGSGLLGACLWAQDVLPTFPNDGGPPGVHSYYPPVGGARFYVAQLRSGQNGEQDPGVQEFLASNPHLGFDTDHGDAAGFHTDDCITFHLVLDGSITLELDEGERKTLGPGDVLVQNGTRHRWIGGEDPATIAMVMIGTPRDDS
jgi:hypothetical protein